MANTVYPKGLQTIASAGINLSTANLIAILVNSSQTYNSAHQYISDLTSGDIIVRSGTFTASSVTSGVISATNVTTSAVASGSTVAAVVIAHSTGTDSTSDLLYWCDHDPSSVALSLATNGSTITLQFNGSGSAAEIFAI